MSLFKFPKNGWQLIAYKIEKNPNLLKAGDWHTMSNGTEAMTPEEILRPYTAHCLAGWVIAITPRAAEYEMLREEVPEYANRILSENGRKPIPNTFFYLEEDEMLALIKRRAAEESLTTSAVDIFVN